MLRYKGICMLDKIEIFISYSHKDERLRDELLTQLKFLERQGKVSAWHDHKIDPGDDWKKEILSHLKNAHIILLLISADFIASDYCTCIEMKEAMRRYEMGEASVIPIILREAVWDSLPFGRLNSLPDYGKPVTSRSWRRKDEAFRIVAKRIEHIVEKILSQPAEKSLLVNSHQLYNSLIRLNYWRQTAVFQQFKAENRHVGAFFIHGAPSHGQLWLLQRLIRSLPNSATALKFSFSFERKACGISLKDLWKYLAQKVGMTKLTSVIDKDSQKEVVERIYKMWQTQSIILTLDKLHEVDEIYIKDFLQSFWQPLTEKCQSRSSISNTNYLLLFFIDNTECIDTWNITSSLQFDAQWQPYIPIKLGKITHFSHEDLLDWKTHELETIPAQLTVQDILDHSYGGIPEPALDHVCNILGHDWSLFLK